jgi:ribosome biogenesis protein NSA1
MACLTGDETGLVKVWNISRSSGATLNWCYGEQTRKRGIAAMCWVDGSTRQSIISMQDGSLSFLDVSKSMMLSASMLGSAAAQSTSMSVVRDKLCLLSSSSTLNFVGFCEDGYSLDVANARKIETTGPVHSSHIHRKFGMLACGGRDNDLAVYDLLGERTEPVFRAANVRDHVLDVPFPVFVTGSCIVSPFVFCTSTAYHQVRFYDRRACERPVQEFAISREIERRPTTLVQWNCNKFLIGEASGDVHLYDTRRGFASRAMLRGGVGSVRHIVKHPQGHQIVAVAGLDRKARIYHVPTGKQILSMYAKQRVTCVLLDRNLPMADNTSMYSGIVNQKVPEKVEALGDAIWDDMDPVCDEFDAPVEVEALPAKKAPTAADDKKKSAVKVTAASTKSKTTSKRNRDE